MLLIFDGMNLAYRAWYSLPEVARSNDIEETLPLVAYLFLQHIISIANDVYSDYGRRGEEFLSIICWDYPGSADRRKKFLTTASVVDRGYKEREVTEEKITARRVVGALATAFGKIHSRLDLGSQDFEADDLIALLVGVCPYRVVIVSRDSDFYQLLARDSDVVICNPYEASDYLTKQGFLHKYGFDPKWWPLWKAIVGDASDTWSGIRGMGAVKTTKYIRELAGSNESVMKGTQEAVEKWGRIIKVGVELVQIPFREYKEPKPIEQVLTSIFHAVANAKPFDWHEYFDIFSIRGISILDAKRAIK